MKRQHNEALDPVWNAVPKRDRYTIDGRRHVMVWADGVGRLVPLAEHAESQQGTNP